MKQIMSQVTTVLFLVFVAFFFLSILLTGATVSEAQKFQTEAVEEMQASHFSSEVIDEWLLKAREKEYTLTVTSDGFYEDRPCYRLELKYPIQIFFFRYQTKNELEAYAL
ncbi:MULTISPECIES: hypothetical protein [Anaerostipes]|uniref:Uncharacterized protein n=1 Tax=Anaerostipes rhamnosivorans TaxID=1229621 RepID=A0A4P8IBU5_9FIRM|nr:MULTISPECIES: hypothetical protein [Anaerostipes]QCP34936.1 hypothetical protein AR1Y2_1482 [Anaerostipes rhamnosivorans]CDC34714.1 putative uncharacterized protein [Anaerostipes sp. CAG:276]